MQIHTFSHINIQGDIKTGILFSNMKLSIIIMINKPNKPKYVVDSYNRIHIIISLVLTCGKLFENRL